MPVARLMETAAGGEVIGLIERYRDGDLSAFERIFDLYKDRVYSLAVHFCRDSAVAEDITQSVFLKLLDRLPQFRGDSGFDSWLFAVVRNACADLARRRKSRPEQELKEAEPALAPLQFERLVHRERADAIGKALAGLSPQLRDPLLLRYVGGLSYEEIADALGARPGTVASRLSRAHLQLARKLKEWAR